jgi:hypothetical protein
MLSPLLSQLTVAGSHPLPHPASPRQAHAWNVVFLFSKRLTQHFLHNTTNFLFSKERVLGSVWIDSHTQVQYSRVHLYFLWESKSWHSCRNTKPFKWTTYKKVRLHLACSTHGSSYSCHSSVSTPQWKQITWSILPENDRQFCNLWQVLEHWT